MTVPMSTRKVLVGQRTRDAVRDTMSDTTLHQIDDLWQDEGFAPPPEDPEPVGGQRVTHFQGYLNQVDWTDPSHVERALRVFEAALRPLFKPPAGYTYGVETLVPRLTRLFERDGYRLDAGGKIIRRPAEVIAEDCLANLDDSAVIREHLDRIARAIEGNDPAQAIGSAKELVESTAKLVLRERGEAVDETDDLPKIVRRAQTALDVHPSSKAPGPDGLDAVKKILGGAVTITAGMAELRNRGFGTGHGAGATRSGLSTRHARLAINGARLWCEFMLDTLGDAGAPWRTQVEQT